MKFFINLFSKSLFDTFLSAKCCAGSCGCKDGGQRRRGTNSTEWGVMAQRPQHALEKRSRTSTPTESRPPGAGDTAWACLGKRHWQLCSGLFLRTSVEQQPWQTESAALRLISITKNASFSGVKFGQDTSSLLVTLGSPKFRLLSQDRNAPWASPHRS